MYFATVFISPFFTKWLLVTFSKYFFMFNRVSFPNYNILNLNANNVVTCCNSHIWMSCLRKRRCDGSDGKHLRSSANTLQFCNIYHVPFCLGNKWLNKYATNRMIPNRTESLGNVASFDFFIINICSTVTDLILPIILMNSCIDLMGAQFIGLYWDHWSGFDIVSGC